MMMNDRKCAECNHPLEEKKYGMHNEGEDIICSNCGTFLDHTLKHIVEADEDLLTNG
jgi:recombinational DNA repair protein (RecF pathway)